MLASSAGILRALSRPGLKGVRKALLHQPGGGGVAQVRIDLVTAAAERRTVHVSDLAGQSHLTAAGAVIGVERLLDLDGAGPEPAGPRFPEQHPDIEHAVAALRDCGVVVARGLRQRLRVLSRVRL